MPTLMSSWSRILSNKTKAINITMALAATSAETYRFLVKQRQLVTVVFNVPLTKVSIGSWEQGMRVKYCTDLQQNLAITASAPNTITDVTYFHNTEGQTLIVQRLCWAFACFIKKTGNKRAAIMKGNINRAELSVAWCTAKSSDIKLRHRNSQKEKKHCTFECLLCKRIFKSMWDCHPNASASGGDTIAVL